MDNSLFFNDIQKEVIDKFTDKNWTTLYMNIEKSYFDICQHCALIPNSLKNVVLQQSNWDLQTDGGYPGFISIEDNNGEYFENVYNRYGNENGIEPLIISRYFSGIKPDYKEISEEFRLFHKLFFDSINNKYIKIDSNGDEHDVIIIEQNVIKVKTHYLKQYLTARDMSLAINISFIKFSKQSISNYEIEEHEEIIKGENYIFHFSLQLNPFKRNEIETVSNSLLSGKFLISGYESFNFSTWFEEENIYEEFKIGQDSKGNAILHTCNPEITKGKSLTPIYFSKTVLQKYYNEPYKYKVNDNYISCGGLWGLRLDMNQHEFVIVALGDLGRDLSYKEQQYWKSYNLIPEGGYSHTTFKRWIDGEFADSDREDLIFKSKFEYFRNKWYEKYQWDLFNQLPKKDFHHFSTLRIPLTENQSEFDTQVISLTKLIIDSINEKAIKKYIQIEDKDKGITKLEKYFQFRQFSNFEFHIHFLRELQNLRSTGSAHLKGKNYEKAILNFRIKEIGLIKGFEYILKSANELIDYLLLNIKEF